MSSIAQKDPASSSGHISLMLALGLLAIACGGSASETPPPLEPDLSRAPKGAPASGRYVVITQRKRSNEAPPSTSDTEPTGDAPATWGAPDAAD